MIHLLIMMVERVGVIVIIGFLLAHTKVFRQFLRKQQGYKGKAVLIFIFLFLALLATTRELKFKEQLFEMKTYY